MPRYIRKTSQKVILKTEREKGLVRASDVTSQRGRKKIIGQGAVNPLQEQSVYGCAKTTAARPKGTRRARNAVWISTPAHGRKDLMPHHPLSYPSYAGDASLLGDLLNKDRIAPEKPFSLGLPTGTHLGPLGVWASLPLQSHTRSSGYSFTSLVLQVTWCRSPAMPVEVWGVCYASVHSGHKHTHTFMVEFKVV